MRFGRVRTIGLHEQAAWIRLMRPEFTVRIERRARRTTLVCRGELQPTAINGRYRVRIEYRTSGRPKVWIEAPKLERRDPETRIPHTYSDDRPCLFLHDFRSDMKIANTIIPWLAMWLFFYECWLVTGVWQGGGLHPGENGDVWEDAA